MTLTIREPSHASATTTDRLGDPDAFSEMVQARLPAMARLAARIAPRESSDDIVQEALIRAWRYRNSYDSRTGSLTNWLMGIVGNEARRAARRQKPLVSPLPRLELATLEDNEEVEAAVRRLPPRQRLAVDCFYYADLTISETAAVMRCSEGTVKSTLADARQRLRAILIRAR